MSGPAAGRTHLVLVGATGMVGGYALRYALEHPAVERVIVIGRRTLGISHTKLNEILHPNFSDCSALAERSCIQDATIFCLGAYTGSVSDTEFHTITVDYTVEFARVLHASSHAVTAAALARELQVSERTIYRDLSELAAQGAPVQGEAGVGYMLRPGLFLPPLMLTEDETEAVLLGLRYVDQRGDDVLTKAAANAHAKILAVLPHEGQIAAILPMTIPGPKANGFPDNKVPLNALRSAIRTCRRLAICYVNGEGHQTQRVIWPIQLGFMDSARVVTGWCELRKAFRFFRTDRISSAEIRDRYPARRADLIRDFHAQLSDEHSEGKSPDRN